MALHPGDIYTSRAFGKPRPVVVVSREDLNRGKYVVVVPMTTSRVRERRDLPNFVLLQKGEAGLPEACVAQCEAVSMIEAESLNVEGGYVGSVSEGALDRLVKALGHVIGADCSRL